MNVPLSQSAQSLLMPVRDSSCNFSLLVQSQYSYRTEILTFDDAFQSRDSLQDLMFHSDQGAQYTSYIFRAHLKELHIKQSFSTPGTPYDNSVCESFFHTLKKEALYHHLYGTPQELQAVLDEYINFYNSQRPHRKLNMKTPNQYESAFYSGCL